MPRLPVKTQVDRAAIDKDLIPIQYLPQPAVSGVYLLLLGGEVVFVGQSEDVAAKIEHHFRERIKVFDSAIYYPVQVLQLDEFEAELIGKYSPRYNVQPSRRSATSRTRDMDLRQWVDTAINFLRETDEDGINARSLYQRVSARAVSGTSAIAFHRAMDIDGRAKYFPAEGVYRLSITC